MHRALATERVASANNLYSVILMRSVGPCLREMSLMKTHVVWLSWVAALSLMLTSNVFAAEEKEEPFVQPESNNPLSGDVDAVKKGRKLYVRWCQQCHGAKLDGYSPRWGQHGADLRVFWRGYKQFVTIVQDGIVEKLMPPHKEYLPEEDILAIGAFIETKSIAGANWK